MNLTDAAVDAVFADPGPRLFVLWFRPGSGRWHRVGQFGSRAECLDAMGGSGDYRIEEKRAEPPKQRGLFDEEAHP
jgi:hypothetical protein